MAEFEKGRCADPARLVQLPWLDKKDAHPTVTHGFDRRRALLTGGAGYIGAAAAESLIELGAAVAIVDREPAACHARAEALGPQAWPLPCDLSDEAAARAAVQAAVEHFGGLDV